MSRQPLVSAAVLALVTAAPLAHAITPAQLCQMAVAGAGRKYFDQRHKTISKCEDAQAKGDPVTCAPADPTVAPKLAQARTALLNTITKRCPGTTLADIDLGGPCEGLATPGDVTDCIVDETHGPAVDDLLVAIYDSAGALSDPDQRKCQKTINKAARKDATNRQKAREKCYRTLAAGGNFFGICPDTKALGSLEKARAKMIETVEKKCPLPFAPEPSPDLDFGFPCEAFELTTFDRDGNTVNNEMPVATRLARCLTSVTSHEADTASAAVLPNPDAAPFSYGVTAGDATATGFIVWTRTDGPAAVTLEVSTNPEFTPPASIVHSSLNVPNPARDNTVKVDVAGLVPAQQYFYRFTQGLDVSRTGRIRTAPLASSTNAMTFVWSGDANAFFKPYSVLEAAIADDADMFLYVGDTIYGDDPRSGTGVATVVSDYWTKYKENRDDAAMRNLMASVGTTTMWDDHEVTNDFYGSPFGAFGPQIIAGNQAFRDYMPIRENIGDPMQLYRTFRWGPAEFFLIDDRQYRSPQATVTEPACAPGGTPAVLPPGGPCTDEINDPSRVYLGAAQKAWLKNALVTSTATFKFVMNGPLISALLFQPYDRWEGYAAERTEILEYIRNPDGDTMTDDHIKNVIFLSTDIHAAIVNDAVANPGPAGGSIREIVAGAIGMDPIFRELPPAVLALVSSLPGFFPSVSYFDIDRWNYVHATVSPSEAVFTYRDPAGTVLTTVNVPAEP